MAFDIEGARQAGYSDAEIADHLATQSKFDAAGARTAGYSDVDIIQHLSATSTPTKPKVDLKATNPAEYDPNSPEWRAKYGAASDSNFENFMAGAGKAVVDTGRGIKQLGAEAGNAVGMVSDQTINDLRANQDEVKKRDADLRNTKAGVAGEIAGNLATTLIPAGGVVAGLNRARVLPGAARVLSGFINPTTFRGAIAAGAAQGALQPVGSDDSRTQNMAFGATAGAAGQALVRGAGAIAQPIRNALTPVDQGAVARLTAAGVPLDAAQQSGSTRAMQVKRFLTDNPLTNPGQVRQGEQTAAGFTRAALNGIGSTADVADEATLAAANRRIGGVFDRVAANNPIEADNQLLQDLTHVYQSAGSELETQQAAVIHRQVDEIINKASGTGAIDGRAYQNIKTTLDRISNQPNQQVGHWARQLRTSLDDALQRSANPQDVADLMQARTHWRNFNAIEKSVGPDGNISPAKLYNAFNVKAYGGKRSMATGVGANDTMRLAKAGKRILPERMPNSGTAPRAALQLLLPGAIGAGVGYAKEGDLEGAAMYGLGGVAAPYAMQGLMNNPRAAAYLANGLGGMPRRLLQAPQSTMGGLLSQQLPIQGLLQATQ